MDVFSRVCHFGRHGVLIWSGSPESSTIYQEACGLSDSFDLFVVCDTWEFVPRFSNGERLSKSQHVEQQDAISSLLGIIKT